MLMSAYSFGGSDNSSGRCFVTTGAGARRLKSRAVWNEGREALVDLYLRLQRRALAVNNMLDVWRHDYRDISKNRNM